MIPIGWYKEMVETGKTEDEACKMFWEDMKAFTGMTNDELRVVLLNEMDKLNTDVINSIREKETLKAENRRLGIDLDTLKNNPNATGQEIAMSRSKRGHSEVKRDDASREVILALKDRGLSDKEICKELGISKSTIWRRLK